MSPTLSCPLELASSTRLLRSKTKVIPDGTEPPIWGFDGSSTEQAPGESSDCVLNPVKIVADPIRGGDDKLVLCEVLNTDMTPHESNTRVKAVAALEAYGDQEPWFGMEQEYTFYKDGRPHGWPVGGFPAPQNHEWGPDRALPGRPQGIA